MSFTAERCRELIATLRAMRAGIGGERSDEDRKAPRVSLGVVVDVRPLVAEGLLPPVAVRVRDISAMGISFVHERPMKPGEHLVFSLPSAVEEGEPLHVLCQVRYSRKVADRLHSTGTGIVQLDFVPPPPVASTKRQPAAASPPPEATAETSEIRRIREAVLG